VKGSGERRSKQLLDGVKETIGYWKWKEEELDRTVWGTGFGRGCGPAVRLKTEWKSECSPNIHQITSSIPAKINNFVV
jgi:hypothetical protein